MKLSHHPMKPIDARVRFHQEMKHQRTMVLLHKVELGLLILCSLLIILLCAYIYGFIG